MNKPDARSISPTAQREKRIIALTMRGRGDTFESIAEAVGVNARTVQKWVSRAETEGEASAIEGKARGYAVGLHRQLSESQEEDINPAIQLGASSSRVANFRMSKVGRNVSGFCGQIGHDTFDLGFQGIAVA
jgi:transposase